MPRRGENIFKRKDGRWEGRYISGYFDNGKAKYSSVYAQNYSECACKLKLAKNSILMQKNPLTVSELFSIWLDSRKNSVKTSTYATYKTMFENYINGYLGQMRVDKVTSITINNYITQLLVSGKSNGEGLSSKSVQSVLIMLKSVFAYGEVEYKLPNSAKNVSMPKMEYKEIEVFDNVEINKIKNNALCSECDKLGILLCLYTGMRIGEICALKWKNIDINNQIINVRKTIQRIKNPYNSSPKTIIVIDEPKSYKSIRDIPIPTFMLDILGEVKDNVNYDNYFLSCSERFIEPRCYTEIYKKFLNDIGVEYKNFHVLRHTFATQCINLGIDVKTVSELLGHSNVKITLERYVHSDINMKKIQLEKLYSGI